MSSAQHILRSGRVVYAVGEGVFAGVLINDAGYALPDETARKLEPIITMLDAGADMEGTCRISGFGERETNTEGGLVRYWIANPPV